MKKFIFFTAILLIGISLFFFGGNSNNNEENNLIIEKEIKKINKIYKKIISGTKTELDVIIDQTLTDIVRYKIFVNDVANFKSYSCNWIPGKDKDPYVKREKFSEFENI